MPSRVIRRAAAVLTLLAFQSAAALPAHAARFAFDEKRTEVRFTYMMGFAAQQGRFAKVSGTLDYDDASPEKARVSAAIETASLSTGQPLVDEELKGPSFFNAKAAPVIAFKSRTVTATGQDAADVMGDITINGITKGIVLKVSLPLHADPALKHTAGARKFTATTRIKRSVFNMTDYQSMVADDVDIEISGILRPRN